MLAQHLVLGQSFCGCIWGIQNSASQSTKKKLKVRVAEQYLLGNEGTLPKLLYSPKFTPRIFSFWTEAFFVVVTHLCSCSKARKL